MRNAKRFCSAGDSFSYLGEGYTLEPGPSVCSRRAIHRSYFIVKAMAHENWPLCALWHSNAIVSTKSLPEHLKGNKALSWALSWPCIQEPKWDQRWSSLMATAEWRLCGPSQWSWMSAQRTPQANTGLQSLLSKSCHNLAGDTSSQECANYVPLDLQCFLPQVGFGMKLLDFLARY